MKLTLIIRQGKTHLIGQFKELPGVLTQGRTIAEVKDNIRDALALYLEDMREDAVDPTDIIAQEELEFVEQAA
ncbi:type II toxin-antitoxin system HicB family antitoxin [Hymenobacter algoricola]|uniref:Type II toxin-antitoxin system HicB family antitoxin n=1 Tax=Hymenobacter algoricola TaxID=486267 RepID=A0ABP7NP77_9BACT